MTLVPTFVPFTPWTTLAGYVDLLDLLEELDLVEHVAPIQLPSGCWDVRSPLLDLPEIRKVVAPFDPGSLTWPWHHDDVRVDALHTAVMQLVGAASAMPRPEVFDAISALAREHAASTSPRRRARRGPRASPQAAAALRIEERCPMPASRGTAAPNRWRLCETGKWKVESGKYVRK